MSNQQDTQTLQKAITAAVEGGAPIGHVYSLAGRLEARMHDKPDELKGFYRSFSAAAAEKPGNQTEEIFIGRLRTKYGATPQPAPT